MHRKTNIELLHIKENSFLFKPLEKTLKFKKDVVQNFDALSSRIIESCSQLSSLKSKTFKKKLFIKGVGYKILFENNELNFKLNFSHKVVFPVPSFIKKVVVNKTNIIFEASDSVLLGNFIESVYNLRPKDNYKGKGFSLKTKVVPRKPIRKK